MVGWQVQQLIKIEIACRVPEKGIICCDSDIFFVKPFDVSVLSNGEAFRFFRRAELQNRETIANPRFLISAAKLLGLKGSPFPAHDYVDQLVTWHGPTVLAMVEHIRKAANRDWRATLGRRFFLSEYTVYGLFVDRVLTDRTQLVPTSLSLSKMIWNKVDWDDEKLTAFFSDLSDSEVAIGAQSFIGIAIERLNRQFELASQQRRKHAQD